MPKLEAGLEADCRKLAEGKGYLLLKWVCPSRVGVPDRMLIKPGGLIIFIEFKRPDKKGKVSPMQERRILELRSFGFGVEVIDNIENFKALL